MDIKAYVLDSVLDEVPLIINGSCRTIIDHLANCQEVPTEYNLLSKCTHLYANKWSSIPCVQFIYRKLPHEDISGTCTSCTMEVASINDWERQ